MCALLNAGSISENDLKHNNHEILIWVKHLIGKMVKLKLEGKMVKLKLQGKMVKLKLQVSNNTLTKLRRLTFSLKLQCNLQSIVLEMS